jgi:hypothetical protein
MHSVDLNMASRLPQSFRLALLDRPHDAELGQKRINLIQSAGS